MESENEVLMVLANFNFNDDEYEYTKKMFDDNGIEVTIAAAEHEDCASVSGKTVETNVSMQNAVIDNFKAVVFIGGPGVDAYFTDDSALELARNFYNANKIVAAICWAPVILARAGILTGRKATVWEGAITEMQKAGVKLTGEEVTIDGTIVTANGPEAAIAFGQAIVNSINSLAK